MLTDLQIRPGIFREQTKRGAQNRWRDCDKVRFDNGLPQKIGGWISQSSSVVVGVARSIHDWASLDAAVWTAIGTEKKLYLWQLASPNTYYDITPLRRATTGAAPPFNEAVLNNPFSVTTGLATVEVTHASHGAQTGDRVRFYNATAVGGITIDGEYEITVLTVNTYQITHSVAASGTAVGGGASVGYEYDISIQSSGGWGSGGWGRGGWGSAISSGGYRPRIWSLDNWGEDLVASPRDGAIYLWDKTNGTNTRAAVISAAPSVNRRILVSSQDRHLIAFGAHDGSNDNPLLVRWCDQENYNDWTPGVTDTAGDQQIDTGSEIVTAIKARGQILLFTDISVHSMRYEGAPYIFGFDNIAQNVRIAGPNAVTETNGLVFVMGKNTFYIYDGVFRPLECDVSSYVYDDINEDRLDQCFAFVVAQYDEIWFFYPSSNALEVDRYVIYNFVDNHWSIGTMSRTCMRTESLVFQRPYGFDANGVIYKHETGTENNTSPMSSYLESWELEIEQGGSLAHISKIVPDFLELSGSVSLYLKTRMYPQDTTTVTKGPFTINSATKKISLRSRGRQTAVRLETSQANDSWRLGTLRLDLAKHGRRA